MREKEPTTPVNPDVKASHSPELYARIKRTSEYYYQGLDESNTPQVFKVEEIHPGCHPFRLNRNNYRPADLAFFVLSASGHLIQL